MHLLVLILLFSGSITNPKVKRHRIEATMFNSSKKRKRSCSWRLFVCVLPGGMIGEHEGLDSKRLPGVVPMWGGKDEERTFPRACLPGLCGDGGGKARRLTNDLITCSGGHPSVDEWPRVRLDRQDAPGCVFASHEHESIFTDPSNWPVDLLANPTSEFGRYSISRRIAIQEQVNCKSRYPVLKHERSGER